jgi:ribosomal protein S18 acetylase RimI-like enzyme
VLDKKRLVGLGWCCLLDKRVCQSPFRMVHPQTMKTKKQRIVKMEVKDFLWDRMRWALDEKGYPYLPQPVIPEAKGLLLIENDTPVSYLAYNVRTNSGYVEIHYAHTSPACQNTGCASKLMNEVSKMYGGEYDFHVYETSGVSHRSLKRWGFEKVDPGQTLWIRKKSRRRH